MLNKLNSYIASLNSPTLPCVSVLEFSSRRMERRSLLSFPRMVASTSWMKMMKSPYLGSVERDTQSEIFPESVLRYPPPTNTIIQLLKIVAVKGKSLLALFLGKIEKWIIKCNYIKMYNIIIQNNHLFYANIWTSMNSLTVLSLNFIWLIT